MMALSTTMMPTIRVGAARTLLSRASAQAVARGGALRSIARPPFVAPLRSESTRSSWSGGHGDMLTQNITALPHRNGKEAYSEDYDEDELHMTPASITSQDGEQLSELEMIRHDDVGSESSAAESFLYYNEKEGDEYTGYGDTEVGDEYEFEEDWEVLHRETSGNAGPCQVLDEVDDVDDCCEGRM